MNLLQRLGVRFWSGQDKLGQVGQVVWSTYTIFGPKAKVDPAIKGCMVLKGPTMVGLMLGTQLGLKLGGANLSLLLAVDQEFVRFKTTKPFTLPAGCYWCSEVDAAKVWP